MSRYSGNVSLIGLVRDHGGGQVVIDDDGEPQALYSITDELDVRNTHRAIEGVVRLHVAAGAREIFGFCASLPRWQSGDDVDAFIERIKQIPLGRGRLDAVLGAPDGKLPDGHRPERLGRRPLRRAARHTRSLDR